MAKLRHKAKLLLLLFVDVENCDYVQIWFPTADDMDFENQVSSMVDSHPFDPSDVLLARRLVAAARGHTSFFKMKKRTLYRQPSIFSQADKVWTHIQSNIVAWIELVNGNEFEVDCASRISRLIQISKPHEFPEKTYAMLCIVVISIYWIV